MNAKVLSFCANVLCCIVMCEKVHALFGVLHCIMQTSLCTLHPCDPAYVVRRCAWTVPHV